VKGCGHRVDSCEVGNEPSCSAEVEEIFDRNLAAPEVFSYNDLDAKFKLILLSKSRGAHASKYQYYSIL